jgi:aryl-alcohol dehydrogenase-like predicted oxidoreductase
VSGPEETWSGATDGPRLITPHTLEQWKTELRTDRLDWVCVHELGDDRAAENRQQQELCAGWLEQGKISRLGIWNPGADAKDKYGPSAPFSFMIRPFNIASSDSAAFSACAALGWDCFACSPFVRGWNLDKLVKMGGAGASAAEVADHMLRFSLHQPFVSGLVTASRRIEWLGTNLQSASRGSLGPEQLRWLQGLAVAAGLLQLPKSVRL